MPLTNHWNVGIIVEQGYVAPPLKGGREPVSQHQVDGRFQALRPSLDGPERGRSPVELSGASGHLAAFERPRRCSLAARSICGLPFVHGEISSPSCPWPDRKSVV